MRGAWLVAVAMLSASTPAQADMEGPALGGQIADICSTGGVLPTLACHAYLRGIVEGLFVGESTATGGDLSFCPSDDFDAEQIRTTFLSYVAAEPERRQEDAGMLMLDALEDGFPCAAAPPGDEADPLFDGTGAMWRAHARR